MKISELMDAVRTSSGQKFIDFEEFTDVDYKRLIELRVLPYISKHKPLVEMKSISISTSPYIFSSAEGIPDWIHRVDPIAYNTQILTTISALRQPFPDINKPSLLFEYNKPNLYIEMNGDFLVRKCTHAFLTEDDDQMDWTISKLDDAAIPMLIDLTLGYVLVAIGRSRRSATLTELPFTFDAAELVSEGEEIIAGVKESVGELNKWWLAVGT